MGLSATVVMIVTGCGGEGEANAENYLADLSELMMEADEEFSPLSEELRRTEFDSEAAEIEATQRFYDQDSEIMKRLFDDVGELRPPPDLEGDHEEYVSAGHGLAEVIAQISNDLSAVKTVAEMNKLIESSLSQPVGRFHDACRQLQTYASIHDVGVDLDCR
jgi:hypothetical protein